MAQRLASLEAIEAAVWQALSAAITEPGHAWRTPVLATTDGSAAEARTVVLREVDAVDRRLRVYTDTRAPKVAQLLSHPLGTLLMWSAPLSWQLRCRVRLTLDDSGLAATSRWATLQHTRAAQDYLSPSPPGAALGAAVPTASTTPARAHFGVVTAEVLQLDWLELHPEGHRRAVFGDGPARWVQP